MTAEENECRPGENVGERENGVLVKMLKLVPESLVKKHMEELPIQASALYDRGVITWEVQRDNLTICLNRFGAELLEQVLPVETAAATSHERTVNFRAAADYWKELSKAEFDERDKLIHHMIDPTPYCGCMACQHSRDATRKETERLAAWAKTCREQGKSDQMIVQLLIEMRKPEEEKK